MSIYVYMQRLQWNLRLSVNFSKWHPQFSVYIHDHVSPNEMSCHFEKVGKLPIAVTSVDVTTTNQFDTCFLRWWIFWTRSFSACLGVNMIVQKLFGTEVALEVILLCNGWNFLRANPGTTGNFAGVVEPARSRISLWTGNWLPNLEWEENNSHTASPCLTRYFKESTIATSQTQGQVDRSITATVV